MVRDFVDEVITVSEEEIVAAMRVCYERMKARLRRCQHMRRCAGARDCKLLPRVAVVHRHCHWFAASLMWQ